MARLGTSHVTCPSALNSGARTGSGGGRSDIGAMLAAAGRSMDSLPGDMQTAYNAGTLAKSAVQRYLELEANWFTRIFLPIQGVLRALVMVLAICTGVFAATW